MSATLENLAEQALKLSRPERLALANRLLSSDEDASSTSLEAIWEEEILARIQAIDSGSAVGVPYEEVIQTARDRRAK